MEEWNKFAEAEGVPDPIKTAKRLKHWYVETPEYTSYYEMEPPETERDFIYVEADTRREAIKKGVAIMRSKEYACGLKSYYSWHWDRDTNPYTGVTARISECEHGFCWCGDELPHEEKRPDLCPQCEEKWQRECKHSVGPFTRMYLDSDEKEEVIGCINCGALKDQIDAWESEVKE